jgi:hypothetical protein
MGKTKYKDSKGKNLYEKNANKMSDDEFYQEMQE